MNRLSLGLALFLSFIALPHGLSAQECPGWEPAVRAPHLADTQIDESSGLSLSRTNPDRLWTHNDSGDSARVFMLDLEGQTQATLQLQGIDARDWEDIAVGPCGVTGTPGHAKSCIYVADIGDNLSVLDSVVIHRFEEPAISEATTTRVISEIESLRFSYADGARDAESLMLHPSGRIFVADKVDDGAVRIWEVPAQFGQTEPVTATQIARHELSETGNYSNLVTAGDFAPDGRAAILKSYFRLYTFCGDPDDPISLFQSEPVVDSAAALLQGEAIAWDEGRQRVWLTSERIPSVFVYHPRTGSTAGEPPLDAGVDAGTDAGRPGLDAGTNDSGDAEAPPDPDPTQGSKKESCQTASGQPGSLAISAVLLLSLAAFRRGRAIARRRRSACAPAS